METPDSPSHICSPEETTKKADQNSSDDKGKTYIKFLLSNVAAGSVIGKGGATITDFQFQSGARVQLSRSNELFPGTSDRIIMITGTINEITKAMELILGKLLNEMHSEDEGYVNMKSKLRIIVPNGSCGSIIGKGGSIIKSFIEDSQAGIKISPLDHNFAGLNDRIVTLTGSIEEQMQAIFLILPKLKEDSHYLVSLHSPFSYKVRYNEMHNGSNGFGGRHQNNKDFAAQVNYRKSGGHEEDTINSVTIGVADEHIGVVLGRRGQAIMEITQATGARIQVSDRGDFISGTSDRKVTITGTQTAIHAAESMITKKVSAHSKN